MNDIVRTMLSYTFTAIDFETANTNSDSACALSLVHVRNNEIVKQETHLIQPPDSYFSFTHIHGLTWNDVAESPQFKEVWALIENMFDGIQFIAAHNASFDRRVLRACCETAQLVPPSLPYICTVTLARKAWKLFPTNLPAVCKHLKIPLVHHDPGSDALACAKIVLAAIKTGITITA